MLDAMQGLKSCLKAGFIPVGHTSWGANGDNYFVELGDFGKYKIIDDKAYNKKYPEGRPILDALGESGWF